jgi:Ras-related protein Rab-1A
LLNLFFLQAGKGEPPFLVIGTAVSAKYKGAFCEAKVKKVAKQVKVKVCYHAD